MRLLNKNVMEGERVRYPKILSAEKAPNAFDAPEFLKGICMPVPCIGSDGICYVAYTGMAFSSCLLS
jgi:hypothetical protein